MKIKIKPSFGKKVIVSLPNKVFIITSTPIEVSAEEFKKFLHRYAEEVKEVKEVKEDNIKTKPFGSA